MVLARSLVALFGLLPILSTAAGSAQSAAVVSVAAAVDTDRDGLPDLLEAQLLEQFAPDFRVGEADCAGLPMKFEPGVSDPTPEREDGTVYGQVFPARNFDPLHPVVEVHFYHLWGRDCGSHGHALDTEHVAVLLRGSEADLAHASWKAAYWYAAAHENTVCDASQITRASTVHAETRGATVWISPGKHASFLDERLCERGCGADRCVAMKRLPKAEIVNLGEPHRPMNGIAFIPSSRWPLEAKMEQSNFAPGALARLNALSPDEIAWYNAGRHPAQGVIAISGATEESLAESGANTSAAISVAGSKTGNALSRSMHNTERALALSARHVEGALDAKAALEGHAPAANAESKGASGQPKL